MLPQKNRELIEGALPLFILLTLFFIGFTTLEPFLPAIVWGIILSVSLRPVHDHFTRRLAGRRSLATLVVGVFMVLILVLPIVGPLSRPYRVHAGCDTVGYLMSEAPRLGLT